MINLLGLIEMYNTYGHNNVYHNVAAALLKNYNRLDRLTSAKIAELCNVSPSTLARFFKMMDFSTTVSKLPELVRQSKISYGYEGLYAPKETETNAMFAVKNYIHQLKEALNELESKINLDQLDQLVKEIASCKQIIFIGCPIPQETWRFQVELVLKGIMSSAYLDPNEQYNAVRQIEEGAILFYFDYCKPSAFQYQETIQLNRSKLFKLVVLSNHPQTNRKCDYLFTFNGTNTEQDFVLMNVFMNLIGIVFKHHTGLTHSL